MSKGLELKVNVSAKGSKESPSRQLGIRLPVQDFKKIKMECRSKGTLYEDPYFPADNNSLFVTEKLPFTPKWLRPKDIVSKPQLYTGGASRFDVSQGMLGDCWLVAAIANLTQDEIMLKRVIPVDDQSFEDKKYCGAFHFRFWHFGEWVDIVIDDRLPTRNGKLIFIHSQDDNEFWSALLEKAYAKLYGSYESLKGGKTSEAMEDFTGGLVESFNLKKKEDTENLFTKMVKFSKSNSFMSCSIQATSRTEIEAKLDNGLVKGHAYSITGVEVAEWKGKKVSLVRIRNPWGQKEWSGDWSDGSSLWKDLSNKERQRLHQQSKDDGEFWMSFDDMVKHYTDMEICSVSMDKLYEDDSVKNWNIIVKNGCWEGENAGGCRNFPTFTSNPQFVVNLDEDDDGDGKCSCLVALMQKNRRKQKTLGVQELCIGFSIYKAPPDDKALDKKYVDYNYSAGTSGSFTNAREVMQRFTVTPGTYIILPCAFKPQDEGEFLLRIFTEKAQEAEDTPAAGAGRGAGAGAGSGPQTTSPMIQKIKPLFDKFAGSDGQIDVHELQDMLTMTFSSDLSRESFCLDACRSMITMLDRDKNGTLDIHEFHSLLQTIGLWKKMFFKFDQDRSGTLEKAEVHNAISSLGYSLSAAAFNILFTRFSVQNKYLKLDDFAACLARVKIMTDVFEKFSDFKSDSTIKLTQDEFYKITLDA